MAMVTDPTEYEVASLRYVDRNHYKVRGSDGSKTVEPIQNLNNCCDLFLEESARLGVTPRPLHYSWACMPISKYLWSLILTVPDNMPVLLTLQQGADGQTVMVQGNIRRDPITPFDLGIYDLDRCRIIGEIVFHVDDQWSFWMEIDSEDDNYCRGNYSILACQLLRPIE